MDVLTILLALLLICIGVGLGATLRFSEFLECLRKKRRAVYVGAFTQFGVMPLVAFFYAKVFSLSDEHAIGLILVGSAPGGVTSNLCTYWSRGDVALSITMSALSTALSFGMLPALIAIYINTSFSSGGIQIPWATIFITLVLLLIPCAAGVYTRTRSDTWAKRLEIAGSIAGGIFLLAALIYGVVSNQHLFSQSFGVWWSSATLQIIGTVVAWACSWFTGLSAGTRRTIAIEAGLQNSSLIIALVGLSYDDNTDKRDRILVCPLLYSLALVWNSVAIVLIFRFLLPRPIDGSHEKESPQLEGGGMPASLELKTNQK